MVCKSYDMQGITRSGISSNVSSSSVAVSNLDIHNHYDCPQPQKPPHSTQSLQVTTRNSGRVVCSPYIQLDMVDCRGLALLGPFGAPHYATGGLKSACDEGGPRERFSILGRQGLSRGSDIGTRQPGMIDDR